MTAQMWAVASVPLWMATLLLGLICAAGVHSIIDDFKKGDTEDTGKEALVLSFLLIATSCTGTAATLMMMVQP